MFHFLTAAGQVPAPRACGPFKDSPRIIPDLVPLREVPKLPCIPLASTGKRRHVATVFRWAQRGIRGIKLKTVQAGGTKCTSLPWLLAFFDQLAGDGIESRPHDTSRAQQVEAAVQKLNAVLRKSPSRSARVGQEGVSHVN